MIITMRLLLDTNVFLALVQQTQDELPTKLRSILKMDLAQAHVSAASLWEAAIKWRLGKLELPVNPDDLPILADKLGVAQLAVSPIHATIEAYPVPPTRDPFDRLLLAQCQIEGLKLLTTDRALAAHPLSATFGVS